MLIGRFRGLSYYYSETIKIRFTICPYTSNYRTTIISNPNQTLFPISTPFFQMEVLEMLAQYGADLNAKNKDDETPSGRCMYIYSCTSLNPRVHYKHCRDVDVRNFIS